MHNIYMKEEFKPSILEQMRLDSVRKEVIKWLDSDIVYSISDRKWISHVQ